MSDEDAVLLDVEDGVATLTLNRPDVRNALTHEVSRGILDALDEVQEGNARCLVVTGAGGAFSAGGDVNAMAERLAGDVPLAEAVERIVQDTSRAVTRVARFPLPTIAKIDGVAFGAGANLAVACDVQLASAESRISFGFRQVGLAVDSGTSYFLPRIVGENTAKELVFTGELVEAERAESLGLFNHVYPENEFDEQADEFVEGVATGPTVALKTSKRLVGQGFESSLDQAMENEAAAQAAVFETHDHREGAESFMSREEPEFEGR
ncbi:enoyl-CoA hydratase/isomerase family protein [Halococcus hamelinensis]|uniref:Enoyl-CoA hydratase I 5 n=1 Tax=Halococcus hamelinensis 100A6 TaxID=1132509 RepID=M0LZB4_9EURY|nr:enoyl-CoA hydratase-related protein [Halococcus hamelinensis]EMA38786.1 enoyl-CoA hydratase I 5 [Halococcus hamelinensis 100A6]